MFFIDLGNGSYNNSSILMNLTIPPKDYFIDCEPGQAVGPGLPNIDILNVVYLINYRYKGGPTPKPYSICNGDANCDCTVNILDVVYLIN